MNNAFTDSQPTSYQPIKFERVLDEPQLLTVNLVRSSGSPVLTGHCLVDMVPQPDLPAVAEHIVASGRQVLSLVGVAALEPGDLLVVAPVPLISVR